MRPIYAGHTASISELKKNPTLLITQAEGQPVSILNHNIATAYLVPAATFERILNALDIQAIVQQRLIDRKKSIKVDLDDL